LPRKDDRNRSRRKVTDTPVAQAPRPPTR
jgi:hypothetical protein